MPNNLETGVNLNNNTPNSNDTEFYHGRRIFLSGGYDYDINWLNGKNGYYAKIDKFITGQNSQPALIVVFEQEVITTLGQKGAIGILELRYSGATWKDDATVHIELCDFTPEDKPWSVRKQGAWVESNASLTLA